MNSKIINISDDQNEITHESGLVTVFEEQYHFGCFNCIYQLNDFCSDKPCCAERRKDGKDGIFVKKIIHENFVE